MNFRGIIPTKFSLGIFRGHFRQTSDPRNFLGNLFPRNSDGKFRGISEEKINSEELFPTTCFVAANRVISELRTDNQANRTHIRSIAGMFDVLAETNPALAAMWQNVRPTINPDSTPEEQADLEQRSVHHSAEIFDDINLNN
ncbi:hypothetical protein F2Q69_00035889 [Brassica cretica]|uniref:Uncharacterized protein n=1 Tax=Brassica cretica TaxID=69181 RepID=A0A8S9SQP7_BRACR|nr:hypothetical protein F2Q69_00035889 [Brassica cretica]